jgi:hypothetical protein
VSAGGGRVDRREVERAARCAVLRAELQAAAGATLPGTRQAERAPPALSPGWFDVDQRSPADWAALLAGHAARLQLPGPDNRPAAHWSALFDGDEALLLARMASERGDAQALADGPDPDTAAPATLAFQVLRLAGLIDRWHRQLLRCPGPAAQTVRALLEELVEVRLDDELGWVLGAADMGDRRGDDGVPLRDAARGLSRLWPRARPPSPTAPETPARGALDAPSHAMHPQAPPRSQVPPPWCDSAVHDHLRSVHALFQASVARLREVAREQLARSLDSGRHDAAAALLVAFLALGGTVQRQLNRFSGRLLDFYCAEVLRMQAHPALPETLHLVARRDASVLADPVLARGTALVAGKDAQGQEIVLRVQDDLVVGAAQVAAVCSLRLDRDPLISPEHELGYVCRARVQHVLQAAPAAQPAAAVAGGQPPLWPLFGGHETASTGPAADADIGLAVASRQLLLLEGERQVTLTLRLGHAATADVRLQEQVARHARLVSSEAAHQPAGLALLKTLFESYAALERRPLGRGLAGAEELARATQPRIEALLAQDPRPEPLHLHYYRAFLVERALRSTDDGFRFAAGRLFIHWLLAPGAGAPVPQPGPATALEGDWLQPDRDALKAAALRALDLDPAPNDTVRERPGPPDGASAGMAAAEDPGDPLALLLGEEIPDRRLVFARLFTGLFGVSHTAPDGWRDIAETFFVRSTLASPAGGVGLDLVARLGAGDPPLVGCDAAVHGGGWQTRLPILRLRLRAYGGLFPYSMLESAQLLSVGLAVQVNGLRQVALHNQLGPLDPAKPFQPFGPLPAQGSYLVLSARELACKPLSALRLNLRWSGLPQDAAGFAAHYAGYPGAPDNRSFRVTPAVLRDGQWQGPSSTPLFAADGPAQPLAARSTVTFDAALLRQHHQPLDGPIPAEAPAFDVGARRSLLQLQLTQPPGAFGHGDYAGVLTEVVSRNARRRRHAPLPRAPYTPTLEGLTVDYRAESVIHVAGVQPASDTAAAGSATAASAAAPVDGDRLYHLHPFGLERVHPHSESRALRLLPAVAHDGNLFIGVQAPTAPSRLTLLFHLHEESAVPRSGPMPQAHWQVLMGDRWVRLSASQVLSDGTAGFLTSGIVVLDLPPGIDDRHQVMPTGLYWLAVGVDEGFERFAGLHGVHAQALQAVRQVAPGAAAGPLSPAGVVTPAVPVPGLASVQPVGPATGGRAAESAAQLKVRMGERLNHRRRASTPWDYERLILENFPDVGQAKCFSAGQWPGLAPGQVLVAVLPSALRFDRAAGTLYPRMNAVELQRMEQLLGSLTSPFARLEVRNAAYERVQVRCTVRLQRGAPEGASLQRCEQAVFDLLCPWMPGGLQASFGWAVRAEEIEARLRELDCVQFVTGLSMLHIVRNDDGRYGLADTARPAGAALAPGSARGTVHRVEVRPAVPWSIAVPMDRHMIGLTAGQEGRRPEATGITQLAIGSNFIIGHTHA